MIAYLLKVTLCALLFLVVYSLFLEKERMHRFKRFYLISSLILSFAIPLVALEIPSGFLAQTAGNMLVFVDEANEEELAPALQLEQEVQYTPVSSLAEESLSVTFTQVLVGLYFVVALFLFIRFLRNVTHLILSAKRGDVISHRGARVVLIEQKMVPHSFMNYIFINKDEYIHQQIENEILIHELVHVKQKHSVDILFIELLLILFWFNPIFYLYRSRMKLNHEFLADEGVVQGLADVVHYQLILLDKVNEKRKLSLASNFNYLITKKRWKDPKVYGVWIDGKKVDNSVLDNYSASDFSNYMVSRLYANAKKGKDYSFQLNLTTKKGYQDYLKNKKTEKPSIYYKEGSSIKKIG